MDYQIVITVKEVRDYCPIYKVGDKIFVKKFYIESKNSQNICIHAFAAISTLLSAFLHGSSAIHLGISAQENIGFLQCPDCGPPYTRGGTVIFELKRELIK